MENASPYAQFFDYHMNGTPQPFTSTEVMMAQVQAEMYAQNANPTTGMGQNGASMGVQTFAAGQPAMAPPHATPEPYPGTPNYVMQENVVNFGGFDFSDFSAWQTPVPQPQALLEPPTGIVFNGMQQEVAGFVGQTFSAWQEAMPQTHALITPPDSADGDDAETIKGPFVDGFPFPVPPMHVGPPQALQAPQDDVVPEMQADHILPPAVLGAWSQDSGPAVPQRRLMMAGAHDPLDPANMGPLTGRRAMPEKRRPGRRAMPTGPPADGQEDPRDKRRRLNRESQARHRKKLADGKSEILAQIEELMRQRPASTAEEWAASVATIEGLRARLAAFERTVGPAQRQQQAQRAERKHARATARAPAA